MKNFFKELFSLLNNDIWYLLLLRCIMFLFLGGIVLFRPAMSLHICAFLLFFAVGALMLFFRYKLPAQLKHTIWLIPLASVCILLFSRPEDVAGICFSSGVCFITFFRAWSHNTLCSKLAAVTALIAGAVLLVKSFSASWFDLYPAVSLSFFAVAAWESGNLKFSK